MPLYIMQPPLVRTDLANTWTAGAQNFAGAASLLLPASGGYAPTAAESVGYDTTQKVYVAGGAGSLTGKWPRVLSVTQGGSDESTGITAAASNTSFLTFATTFAIPASYLIANKALLVAAMFMITSSASPPNLTTQLQVEKSGPVDKILFTSAAITPPGSLVTRGFGYVWTICGTTAAGASVAVDCGTLDAAGTISGTVGAATPLNTVAQPVAAIDTTSLQTIQLMAKWSANTAGNTLFLQQLVVMELN